MPFKKIGPDDNVSPSGRHFTDKQVRMYYATAGFTRQGGGKFAHGTSQKRMQESASVRRDTLPRKGSK